MFFNFYLMQIDRILFAQKLIFAPSILYSRLEFEIPFDLVMSEMKSKRKKNYGTYTFVGNFEIGVSSIEVHRLPL